MTRFAPVQRLVIFIAMVALSLSVAIAQNPLDEVWIEPSAVDGFVFSPRTIIHRTGTIETLDDKTLTIIVPDPNDATKPLRLSFASSRLIWVEPGFDDDATIAAVERSRRGDHAAAIPQLLAAVNRGPAVWRAQWLSMSLWQSAYAAGRYAPTLELVDQIDARPLPNLIVGGLPIHWTADRLPPAAMQAARDALANADAREATHLCAASWLIGAGADAQATAVLQQIINDTKRPPLAMIAKTLLWRTAPPPTVVENARKWAGAIDRMPMTLTPGPMRLLADRLAAAGEKDVSNELRLSLKHVRPRP